jgi:hypothetical protein
MCNSIHNEHQPIPEKGFGWKIFESKNKPCFGFGNPYEFDGQWVRWNKDFQACGDGFCFFLTQKEAQRALDRWWDNFEANDVRGIMDPSNRLIRRIAYQGGLCRQQESNMIDGITVTMALCTKWRFAPTKKEA